MLDWKPIDLGDARATGLTHSAAFGRGAVVIGQRGDRPFVALVDGARLAPSDNGVPTGSGRVWSATFAEETITTYGSPPRMVHRNGEEAVEGSPDEPPVRGWAGCGDEDLCLLAMSAGGELWAHEDGAGEPVGGVWADPARADAVVVAGAEIGLVVAGPLGESAAATGQQVWRFTSLEWERVVVADPPDAFTSAYEGWEPVLGGHRNGLPVLFSADGGTLPAPRVRLDPAHPFVDVAHVDRDAGRGREPRTCLAVQAAEGPQLWLRHDHGWTMLPGPEGRLAAGRLGYREKENAWLVVDGRLWYADLSAAWDALTP